ncbi:hypothetical protein BH11CYA1_BH11CYA1_07270 [soil metagenome]
MKVQFVDFSLERRPERTFQTTTELTSFLRQLQSEEPSAGELVGENGYKLTVGIDGQVAFVQYSNTNGDPPYLVAQARTIVTKKKHDFIVTGSPTEVDGKCCLPFSEFEKVVCDFMETGQKSPFVEWADA